MTNKDREPRDDPLGLQMISTLVFMTALVTAAPQMEARLVSGKTATGALAQVTADAIALETPSGPLSIRRDELLSLNSVEPSAPLETPAVWIELIDGSTLIGTKYEATKSQAKLTVIGNDKIELSTKAIRFVRFSPPDEATDAQWAKALAAKVAGDLLVVRKREALDQVEGIVGDVDADKVVFELDREPMDAKRARVDGFIFAETKRNLGDPVCVVEDAMGNRLQARDVQLVEDKLVATTPAGAPIARPLDRIAKIDFSASTLRYLSDLKPDSLEWTPFFGFPKEIPAVAEAFKPRRDRDLEGGPIRLGGNRYTKGLGLSSRTSITYRVPTGFRAFKALAGIDDAVRDGGNVRLEISGDGEKLFEQTLTGKDEPRAIDLDLSSVKKLTILVDFGDDSDVADHVNLAEARFTK